MERGLVSEEGSSDIASIDSAGLSSGFWGGFQDPPENQCNFLSQQPVKER